MKLPRVLESNSIQITIAVSFLVIILVTIVFLGTTTLVLTRDALWETSTYYSDQLVGQVATRIGAYLTDMENVTAVLLDEIPDPLPAGGEDLASARASLQQTLATIARLRPDISLIGVVAPELGTIVSREDRARNPRAEPTGQSWYRRAVAGEGSSVYTGARIQNIMQDEYRWVVTVARARGELVLFVDLTFRSIEELARSVEPGTRGYLFIMDASGSIVYHPQQQLIFSDLFREPIDALMDGISDETVATVDGEQRLYLQRVVRANGWRVVSVSPVDELLATQRRVQSYYLGWLALVVALVMVLSYIISRRIAQPIMRLRRSMQAVEQGRFDIEINVDSADEIGALSRDFAITVAKIQELLERSEREQEQKRVAEIRALQHQITPHFLYNTLDSIVWMAEDGRTEQVVSMTTNLARLLRLSIGRGEAMVRLGAELDYLRSYLAIQQMRYRDRLTYAIDSDPSALDCLVPRLTLQPLVENAIYHGVKRSENGGHVSVQCRALPAHVEVRIIDDGPGMDEETLRALRSHRIEPEEGVGLKNVHKRLVLTFGPEYGVEFESAEGHGTTVYVRVPWEVTL